MLIIIIFLLMLTFCSLVAGEPMGMEEEGSERGDFLSAE
jgi:hypothetical protein